MLEDLKAKQPELHHALLAVRRAGAILTDARAKLDIGATWPGAVAQREIEFQSVSRKYADLQTKYDAAKRPALKAWRERIAGGVGELVQATQRGANLKREVRLAIIEIAEMQSYLSIIEKHQDKDADVQARLDEHIDGQREKLASLIAKSDSQQKELTGIESLIPRLQTRLENVLAELN